MKFSEVPPSPVAMLQSPYEFGSLWELAVSVGARRVVEIGSLFGGTLWSWLHLPGVEEVVSVDHLAAVAPWPDTFAEVVAARELWSGWPGAEKLATFDLDSHDRETIEAVGFSLGWRRDSTPIDVLFLDGDHERDGVARDFSLWSPLVRPGGLVGFHDTVKNGTRDEPGIREVVAGLKMSFASVEFFDPTGAGLTVFRMPDA